MSKKNESHLEYESAPFLDNYQKYTLSADARSPIRFGFRFTSGLYDTKSVAMEILGVLSSSPRFQKLLKEIGKNRFLPRKFIFIDDPKASGSFAMHVEKRDTTESTVQTLPRFTSI